MSTRFRVTAFAGVVVFTLASMIFASAATSSGQHKAKTAKPAPAPLPSGPTGPVPQIPLDSMAAVPPQVTFQNGQLTIVAPNSTLGDILRAVKKQTGADIDVPAANDRVVTRLGPGPARDVMADLLNGSRFNYVLLGSPQDSASLTRVILVAKSAPDNSGGGVSLAQQQPPQPQQPAMMQQPNMAPAPQEMAAEDPGNGDQADEQQQVQEENDQAAAEAEQQQQDPNGGVKTPQQMLQEMQQRQMQMQQQLPAGQAPIPGSGMPPHPPQEP